MKVESIKKHMMRKSVRSNKLTRPNLQNSRKKMKIILNKIINKISKVKPGINRLLKNLLMLLLINN